MGGHISKSTLEWKQKQRAGRRICPDPPPKLIRLEAGAFFFQAAKEPFNKTVLLRCIRRNVFLRQ
jgi:hypothetical protein